ncbi:hybrid sensor histidine kinase/response regulator [Oceanicoccus sp. KOV_DT_Chl]|uniref:hybrid sensor histidine kinase/response regulator n=1 Tax=Oceanicoccus sp. KOV_DT_Chl TaxID=1904639 RepID=UPI000C7B3A7C|nr:hybrid sensor histidine kinase/response regulator [Oceanicoccus sp. KOV_DT_Chl]
MKFQLRLVLSCFLFLLALPSALLANQTAIVDQNTQELILLPYSQVGYDEYSAWSIQDAQNQQFQPMTSPIFGHRSGSIWIKAQLHNDSSERVKLILDSGYIHNENVEYFLVENTTGAVLESGIGGISKDFSQRPLASISITFPLDIKPASTIDLYLRINSHYIIKSDPVLFKPIVYFHAEKKQDINALLFYGVLLGLIFYSAIFSFYVKEIQYLIFGIFLSSWSLLISASDGYIYLIWPYYWLGAFPTTLFYSLSGLSIMTLSVFTVSYLNLKNYEPIWLKIHSTFIILGVIICFSPLFFDLSSIYAIFPLIALALTILCVASGLRVYRNNHKYALEFAIYFGIMQSLMLAFFFVDLTRSESSIRFILLMPVCLFFISIGQRMNRLKNDAQKLQKEAELAQHTAEFKSSFLAAMSHEIRTPMNGVLGMVEIMKETPLDYNQKQYLDIIKTSGKSLLSIINDILDFSKLESGNIGIESISINLESLIDECIAIFSGSQKNIAVDFSANISANLPANFIGDPSKIKQVLINLLSNAFKFTEQGNISLEVEEEFQGDAHYIRFSIKDTGLGIDDKTKKMVFQPFGQADNSISRKYGGTGLGLAISKQLVEAMGGNIRLESVLGKGSTFSFLLPLTVGNNTPTADKKYRLSQFNNMGILLIDDHQSFSIAMQKTLQTWGFNVDIAATNTLALEKISTHYYDLIFLENVLPDGDGLEYCLKFRKLSKNQNLKIISIGAGSIIPDTKEMKKLGIQQHLMKPILFSSMAKAIYLELSDDEDTSIEDNSPTQFENIKILIAEDNTINQLVIKSLLGNMGIDCDLVENGKLALEKYQQSAEKKDDKYDAILMDCEMPVMDGYTATEKIREHEIKNQVKPAIPIIGLSAHALDEFKERALSKGMNYYITKPVNQSELNTVFLKLISSNSDMKN